MKRPSDRLLIPGMLMLALAITQATGCSSDSDEHDEDTPAGVIFEGAVTDESYASVAGLPPKTDDGKAAVLSSPMNGASVPSGQPVVLTWTPSTAAIPRFPTRRYRATPAWQEVFGERVAHAHGTPVSGIVYLVAFSGSGGKVVELLTDKTSYTPDGVTWEKLKSAKTITVKIVAAKLDSNAVTGDGGPFVASKTATFTIE